MRMPIKTEIYKAYDRLECDFITTVMNKMGFSGL